jgi:hypothetical protein
MDALVVRVVETGLLMLSTRRNGQQIEDRSFQTDRSGILALRAELAKRPASERLILSVDANILLEKTITLPTAAEPLRDG